MKKLLTTIFLLSASIAKGQVLDTGTIGGLNSTVKAINYDGSVFVGKGGINNSKNDLKSTNGQPYRGYVTGPYGTTKLASFGGSYNSINSISDDGSVAAGTAYLSGNNRRVGFYLGMNEQRNGWSINQIGFLTKKANGQNVQFSLYSTVNAVSGDGSIVVGNSDIYNGKYEAIKFDIATKKLSSIGSITDGLSSNAIAVSRDGSVIVGEADIATDNKGAIISSKAFKYDGAMVDIGGFGGARSAANAVSADGSIIAGYSMTTEGNKHAFKYDGAMVDLGTLGGSNSQANGISADGKIVVGSSQIAGDVATRGFINVSGQSFEIGTLGGTNSSVNAISGNGQVFGGESDVGDGSFHGFVAKTSDMKLVDINNTASTIAYEQAKLKSVLNYKSDVLNMSLSQDAKLFGKNNISVAIGARYTKINPYSTDSVAGTFKAAYKFSDNFRAGVFLDQGANTNLPSGYNINNQKPLISYFATFTQNKDDTGFKLRLAYGKDRNSIKFTRAQLANTEAGSGQSTISSKGHLVELSYGFNKNGLNFQPYAGVRRTRIERQGYVEEGANFPINFAGVSKKNDTFLAGSRVALQVSNTLSLRGQAGYERDFNNQIDGFSGSAQYLGAFDMESTKNKRNRKTYGVGATKSFAQDQEINVDFFRNQQSLNNAVSNVVYVNYTKGF